MRFDTRHALYENITNGWSSRLECRKVLEGHRGCVNGVSWSTDGELMASGSDDLTVKVWGFCGTDTQMELRESVRTIHMANILEVQFQPGSRDTLVTAGLDGCVSLVTLCSIEEARKLSSLNSSAGRTTKIAFQPTDPNIFLTTASRPDCLLLTDLRTKHHDVIATFPLSCNGVDFNPENPHEFALGMDSPTVKICDLRKSGEKCVVAEIDTAPELHGNGCVSSVKYHKNGREFLACLRGDRGLQSQGDVRRVGVSEKRTLSNYSGHHNVDTIAKEVAYLDNHNSVTTGSDCGRFFIWNRSTGDLIRAIHGDSCIVNCITPHPDLPLVAVSGIDSSVKIFTLPPTDKRTMTDKGSTARGFANQHHPDAEPILSVSECVLRVEEASGIKIAGNDLVKQKNHEAALSKYKDLAVKLRFVAGSHATQNGQRLLLSACYSNMAHCAMQLKRYHLAVTCCDKTLDLDPTSIKALYRKAVSLSETKDHGAALVICAKGLALNPADQDFQKLEAKIQVLQKAFKKAEMGKYKGMFA